MISNDELVDMYVNQKLPIKTICKKTHTDRKTIHKQLLALQIPIENRNGFKTQEHKDKIAKARKEYWSNADNDDRNLHSYRVKRGRNRRYIALIGTSIDGFDIIDYNVESGNFIMRNDYGEYKEDNLYYVRNDELR